MVITKRTEMSQKWDCYIGKRICNIYAFFKAIYHCKRFAMFSLLACTCVYVFIILFVKSAFKAYWSLTQ